MARWIFVRHGESRANANGTFAGHRDSPLTEQGRAQARALRERLEGLSFDRVLSSDLRRAADTAALALGDKPEFEVHQGLRERSLGDWEGEARQVIREAGHFPTLLSWTGRPPGGESQRDLAMRVLSTLAHLEDHRDTLVFGHGGMMRVVLGLTEGTPIERIGFFGIDNGAIHTLELPPSHFADLLRGLP